MDFICNVYVFIISWFDWKTAAEFKLSFRIYKCVQVCAFGYKIVNCGIWDLCIMGFVQQVYYIHIELWDGCTHCYLIFNGISLSSWWRHQMQTFSALLALCAGNSPVTGEFPSQRPVTRGFDVFFDLCLDERLSKQSRRRWFETPPRSLWRHCNIGMARHYIPQKTTTCIPYCAYPISHRCHPIHFRGFSETKSSDHWCT